MNHPMDRVNVLLMCHVVDVGRVVLFVSIVALMMMMVVHESHSFPALATLGGDRAGVLRSFVPVVSCHFVQQLQQEKLICKYVISSLDNLAFHLSPPNKMQISSFGF